MPCQPLVDGKHCIIPGQATHRRAALQQKNPSLELLTLKWIQLLLIFSWGFQPPQRLATAVRKVHELSELFAQSNLGDTVRTGDAEEQERESKTVTFNGALFTLSTMLFWSLTVKV